MLSKKYLANYITISRIVLSFILLFCSKLSPVFYLFYLLAGASDIIDGMVARKTNTESEFGSKLDTFADFIFVAVCLIKLLPVYSIQDWQYIWLAVIVFIKAFNILINYFKTKHFLSFHSLLNKVTGGVLFLIPFTLSFIDVTYSTIVLGVVATVAAVWECYYVIVKTPKVKDEEQE